MSDPFLGEIRIFAGNFAPQDWALCNGAVLSISQNEALFSLIGTTYGGDGSSTFALPDLRGRLPVGQGTRPGLTARVVGQQFGTETVTLTTQQLPSHNHAFAATTSVADSQDADAHLFSDAGDDTLYVSAPTDPQLLSMDPGTVANAGGAQPHINIMSSLAMNYIICTAGIYPSRN